MFKNPRDFFISTNAVATNYVSLTADSNYIYAVTAVPNFKKIELNTGKSIIGNQTISTGPAAITMITQATACVMSNSSNVVDFIDVNTSHRTTVSTNATTLYTNAKGQIADSMSGISIGCRNTTGGLLKAASGAGSVFTLTNMTVSALSGVNARSILAEPASGVWFVGTSDGRVITIDSNGNLQNTITLSKNPSIASTTISITGLSFWNPYLLISTDGGTLHLFDYRNGQEVDRFSGFVPGSTFSCQSLTKAVNGYCFTSRSKQSGSNILEISMINFQYGKIIRESHYIECTQAIIGQVLLENKCVMWNNSNSFMQARSYDLTSYTPVSVTTEAQDPAGTEVSSRLIRFLDLGPGKKVAVNDQNIIEGTNSINAINAHDYVELAIRSNKWDIREFQS